MEEQQLAINALIEGKNIIVDAVAGSGKTTLILEFAAQSPHKNILQITYNTGLKEEVRKKVISRELKNIEIHSYHSLARNYYNYQAITDQGIHKILNRKTPIMRKPHFDYVIIDETQDMNFLYYQFVRKFISDLGGTTPVIGIIGDKMQTVYEYNGADSRYLTGAAQIWGIPFQSFSLNTSYRLTRQISDFVEACTGRHINTMKTGPKVEYIYGGGYKYRYANANYIVTVITTLISSGLYTAGDIFVLSPSLKNKNHPCYWVEKKLVLDHGIKCHFSKDSRLVETDNKLVITTLNQSKGLERKCVIVYDFSSAYFDYYAGENPNRNVCPNLHYVAMTRASNLLIVVHDSLAVINYLGLPKLLSLDCVVFPKNPPGDVKDLVTPKDIHRYSVTEFISHLHERYLETLSMLKWKQVKGIVNNVELPVIAKFDSTNEQISDIIGVAIPALYELDCKGIATIMSTLGIEKINDVSEMLQIASQYISTTSGIHSRYAQITHYDWLTSELITNLVENIHYSADTLDRFEVPIKGNYKNIDLVGTIDAISVNGELWEFKCVQSVGLDHFLQLAVYSYLTGVKKCNLLNCRTGELYRMDECDLIPIMEALLDNKLHNHAMTDEEFYEQFK